MKKAFEQNVSRAKPRVRLGALTGVLENAEGSAEAGSEPEAFAPEAPAAAPDLSAEVRARIERARAPRPSASEAVSAALRAPLSTQEAHAMAALHSEVFGAPAHEAATPRVTAMEPEPVSASSLASPPLAGSPLAHADAPATEVEIQTPSEDLDPDARRERLKERLKAVRENPRPEPLPASVAEAGMRAVERINALQSELNRVKALNLSLTQELEVTRRQSEKATEEARLRMDEARRLSSEMEARVKLLSDLERELAALEGERDEALLSLQEARQALQAAAVERDSLETQVSQGKKALTDSLAEEERLATELEGARDETSRLTRAVETLQGERDVLAQQVASLTAERAELLEARKALESVHRALSQAISR
ncbi:extensin-like protein [Stigmatella sp. ncwal1]|uniref:Extensin-like protein n=1 Tax=Stigmatella ashevillensis TaxID=2995309 RepID=A0ABT5DBZ0_9BACT|nr:extensin-like protein [Stigmatella ashevillena]MDC0711036.1 extensin-like protein [Stigmatella ashevillena]